MTKWQQMHTAGCIVPYLKRNWGGEYENVSILWQSALRKTVIAKYWVRRKA